MYAIRVSMTDLAGIVSNTLSGNFRVANNPWVAKAPMPNPRRSFAVATTGGFAYVMGGELMNTGTIPGPDSALVEVYDPANNTWAAGVALPTARKAPVAAVVNGVIYVIGGYNLGAPGGTSLVEAFDTGTSQWSTKAAMPMPRHSAAAAVVGGQICVFGGESAAFDISTTECYDPVANSWSAPPPPAMPTARRLLGADALGGLAYAVGGYATLSIPQYLKTVERFDIAGPSWSTMAPLLTERESAAVVAASGLLYAFGGGNVNRSIDSAEAFNPATGTWSSKTPLPMPITSLGAVAIGGVVYVFEQNNTLQYTPGDDLL
jgi:N-acetylneuraminic acid mutarotase